MPETFIELRGEPEGEGRTIYVVYVVAKTVGRVRLARKETYEEAKAIALDAQEDFGALFDRTYEERG